MLKISEKPLHASRAHFGGQISGGLEVVLADIPALTVAGVGGLERAEHPAAL